MMENWQKKQEERRAQKAKAQATYRDIRRRLKIENKYLVEAVRSHGFTPMLNHWRTLNRLGEPEAKGGHTIAIAMKENDLWIEARASCSPKDHYDKLIGANIALSRLWEVVRKL